MPPVINRNECIGCYKCVEICQMDVFFGSEQKQPPVITYPEECWHCNSCVMVCPVEHAIKVRLPLPAVLYYKAERI